MTFEEFKNLKRGDKVRITDKDIIFTEGIPKDKLENVVAGKHRSGSVLVFAPDDYGFPCMENGYIRCLNLPRSDIGKRAWCFSYESLELIE